MILDGITNSVLSYFETMDRNNVQVDFINTLYCDYKIRERIMKLNARIYDLPMRNKNPLFYIWKLKKVIRNEKYDIVHAHGSSGMLALEMVAAYISKVKVRIAHSHNTTCRHLLLDKLLRPLLYTFCTNRFACGELAGKWLFKNRCFSIIKNGIVLNQFLFDPDVRDHYRKKNSLNEKLIIGHVGFFNKQKNHQFLIDVFREVHKVNKDTYLVLIGKGDEKESIEEKINAYGLAEAVCLTGAILDVSSMIQMFDIVVLPSLYEGLPIVSIEWQLAGIPCFISDSVTKECAFTDLVTFLPLEAGVKEWAKKILACCPRDRNAEKAKIYEQANRAGYNIEVNAESLKFLYIDLIEKMV